MPLSKMRMRHQEAGLVLEGNHTSQALQSKSSPVKTESNSRLPLYNPAIHGAGDRVLVRPGKKLIEITIPEIDADGRSMPEFT